MASRRMTILLLATALAAGCSQDAPTAADLTTVDAQLARGAAAKMVPFKASFNAPAGLQPVPSTVCPTEFADITAGGGQATHLGRFSGNVSSCVNLATLQVTDGRFAFTGADGSQVMGTYQLQGTPLSPTVIRLDGPFTITGGSGRLAGATGGGTVTGQVDLAAGTLELHFDGTISSVGSLR